MIALLAESAIRLHALLRKEFRQLLRDPRMRFFVVVPPLIQLLVFGYAASYDVRRAEIGVVDPVRSEQTRALLGAVTADGTFTATAFADMRDAARAIDRGTVRAVLHFSPDFDHDHRVQLIADGSDSNSALMIVGQLAQSLQRAAGATAPIAIEERAWLNPNLDDRWFFVPGIIATVLLISTSMLIAMAVVREREIGTLERMMVTPVARIEFLLGKIAPVVCIGLVDVALVCVVAVYWFEVPMRCTVGSLTVATLLYLASTLGIGLLIELRRDAAAGGAVDVLRHDADDPAFGLRLPHSQHAGACAVVCGDQSAQSLPLRPARHVPEGRRHRRPCDALRRHGGARFRGGGGERAAVALTTARHRRQRGGIAIPSCRLALQECPQRPAPGNTSRRSSMRAASTISDTIAR